MPVKVDFLEDRLSLPVKPDTNEHALLETLVAHPDLGFSAGELAELTGITAGSVSKSLARLEEKGLVRRMDGYWTAADDVVGTALASIVSLDAIEDRYGDDAYGRSDDWVEELPDLGENA